MNEFEHPTIYLTLTDKNSSNKMKVVKEKGKPLDMLVQTFTTTEGIIESTIKFKLVLTLTPTFFLKENYASLLNCLTLLGCYLVELDIIYPANGGTLPVHFPKLNLPSLEILSFQFSDIKVKKQVGDLIPFGNNARGMWLLQSIFNATKNLANFWHPFKKSATEIPQDFEFLWLPPTISELELNLKLESNGLKVLVRNDLPNLTYLKLLLHDNPLEDDLLHKILKRVQKTLTHFDIKEEISDENPIPQTHLRFPVMKNLREVRIESTQCELGPEPVSNLHECLPKLIRLTLFQQPAMKFKKWIENVRFENVKEFMGSLVDEGFYNYVSYDEQMIQRMNLSFPNVTDLNLHFNVSNMSGLNCIFQNMTQLSSLSIYLMGNVKDYSSDLFDSQVLDMPLTVITSLKEGERYGNDEFRSSTSITNLSGTHEHFVLVKLSIKLNTQN